MGLFFSFLFFTTMTGRKGGFSQNNRGRKRTRDTSKQAIQQRTITLPKSLELESSSIDISGQPKLSRRPRFKKSRKELRKEQKEKKKENRRKFNDKRKTTQQHEQEQQEQQEQDFNNNNYNDNNNNNNLNQPSKKKRKVRK